jgi:hypothetical protein
MSVSASEEIRGVSGRGSGRGSGRVRGSDNDRGSFRGSGSARNSVPSTRKTNPQRGVPGTPLCRVTTLPATPSSEHNGAAGHPASG